MKITFTDKAKQRVVAYMEEAEPKAEPQVLRITIAGKERGDYGYQFGLDLEKNQKPDDVAFESGGFKTLLDEESAKNMDGAEVDWVEGVNGSGFQVQNPNKPKKNLNSPDAEKIQQLLDTEINPGVASHGGSVELIDVDGEKVYLKLGGGCQGCGMVDVTLRQGIEVRIKEILPHIKSVVDTTDHAGGTNPYYSPGK